MPSSPGRLSLAALVTVTVEAGEGGTPDWAGRGAHGAIPLGVIPAGSPRPADAHPRAGHERGTGARPKDQLPGGDCALSQELSPASVPWERPARVLEELSRPPSHGAEAHAAKGSTAGTQRGPPGHRPPLKRHPWSRQPRPRPAGRRGSEEDTARPPQTGHSGAPRGSAPPPPGEEAPEGLRTCFLGNPA